MSNDQILLIGVVVLTIMMVANYLLKKHKIKTFINDGISIDETRVSIVAITFIIWNIIAMYLVLFRSDIPDNILYLILGLGGGIVGTNIGNSNIGRKNKENYNNSIPSTVSSSVSNYTLSKRDDNSRSGK